jgi:LacI family transcriptional regulator
VDGIILWAHLALLCTKLIIEDLEMRNLPVVTIDHELPFADTIETDEQMGTRLTTKHLLGLGHRYLVQLTWDDSYKWTQLRRLFFEQQIKAARKATCITVAAKKGEKVASLTRRAPSSNPSPKAIFACNDWIAKLIYQILKPIGLRIPQDLSIMRFADFDFTSLMKPALITIRQKGLEIGKSVARLLIHRSQGKVKEHQPQRLQISCELIKRSLTPPLRKP